MTYHARTTWVHPAPPITGPLMNLRAVDTVVIHYPAGPTPDGDPTDRTDVAAYLRQIQTGYVRDRGYSIGYSFAIDHRGDVWECRGWDIKPAANKDHNDHTLPLLMIVDQDEPATDAALDAARGYVAELAYRTGRPIVVTGHGQLPGAATGCPGVGLRAQIAAGKFRPLLPPPPVTPQEIPDVNTLARRVRIRGTQNVFLIGAGPALHLTPELDESYSPDVPLVVVEMHSQFAMCVLFQAGLEPPDLIRHPEGI